jgi:hypothetical protein
MLLAVLAAVGDAPLNAAPAEPAFTQEVRRAALELCPGLVRGRVTEATLPPDRPAFHRLRALEARLAARSKADPPLAIGGETGGNGLLLIWSPKAGQCQVTFKGAEAAKALTDVRSALDAAGSGYARAPRVGNPAAGFPSAFVYRSRQVAAALQLNLYLPSPDDASRSHVVEVQALKAR